MLPLKPPYNVLHFINILLSPNICAFWDMEIFLHPHPIISALPNLTFLTSGTQKFKFDKSLTHILSLTQNEPEEPKRSWTDPHLDYQTAVHILLEDAACRCFDLACTNLAHLSLNRATHLKSPKNSSIVQIAIFCAVRAGKHVDAENHHGLSGRDCFKSLWAQLVWVARCDRQVDKRVLSTEISLFTKNTWAHALQWVWRDFQRNIHLVSGSVSQLSGKESWEMKRAFGTMLTQASSRKMCNSRESHAEYQTKHWIACVINLLLAGTWSKTCEWIPL